VEKGLTITRPAYIINRVNLVLSKFLFHNINTHASQVDFLNKATHYDHKIKGLPINIQSGMNGKLGV
jgi:hypothetical protein